MVLSDGSGCLFLGGCGTSASSPLGVRGVITMKMMSSTSSTSTSGVTLMSDRAPPEAPNANAMDESPVPACYVPLRLPARSRRHYIFVLVLWRYLFGQQSHLVNARRADIVHHLHHGSILCFGVSADKDAFIRLVLQPI